MRISRRAFVAAVVAAGATAALGSVATTAAAAPGGGRYEPGPRGARVGPLAKPTIPDRAGAPGAPGTSNMPDMPNMPHGGPVTAPGPNARVPGGMTGDMIMQRPDGRWVTHLLPFAGPFPDRASAAAEIKRNRDQGLIR